MTKRLAIPTLLLLLLAGLASAQANFTAVTPANIESDNTIYYQGAWSYPLGAIGTCGYPYIGTNANAGYVTDYISCPASLRSGSTEVFNNRQVGQELLVDDSYTNPATGTLQVFARLEADCPQNPNGHWVFNRVYVC